MKKSLVSLLLAIAMLVMLVLPASAATGSLNTTIKLNSDGTGFTVELNVKDNPGIIAMTGKVTYDSKVFKLKDVKNGEIFEGVFMSSQNLKVIPYQTIWMEATADEDIKTNGVLATYTFEVLKNAPLGESEIKFEISETVNYEKDVTSQFTGCSFKVNVRNNSGDSEPVASDNDTADDQTLNVQKPLVDNTDPETVTSETQSSEKDETTSSDTSDITVGNDETIDEYEDDVEIKDRTLITIITIAAVLVLGLAVTFTALYFRKKSGNKNNAE